MEAATGMKPEVKWSIVLVEWDKETGAITNVQWKVTASDGESEVSIPGASRFSPDPSNNSFIPLDEITEEKVIEWVKKKTPNYVNTEKRALKKLESSKAISSSDPGRGIPWEGIEIPKQVPRVV